MLDSNSGPADQTSAQRWADRYDIVHPVLADSNGVTGAFVTQGYPTYPVINPDMTIINEDLWPFNASTLGQYIANGN